MSRWMLERVSARVDPQLKLAIRSAAHENGRSLEAEIEHILRAYYKLPAPETNGNGKPKAERQPTTPADPKPARRGRAAARAGTGA